jgi:hypothetical protein
MPANFGDLYAYHYPLRHLVTAGLESGRLPFWNPYIFCGLPLSANSQAGLFYPVGLLGRVLPLGLSFSWDYLFHLCWGALGMMLLARRERLRSATAAFLAGIYVFSPFLLYRITEGIPTLLAALAWVPWCWLAFLSSQRALLAVVWGLQFLSGHPQFMLANGLAMAVWALCRRERWRLWSGLAAAGAGAALLTAVQWTATWQFLGLSVRRGWPAAFTAAYSILPRTLWTWLYPNALGTPMDGTFSDVPSVFFESAGVFIGWVGLAAAAFGAMRARSWRPFVLVGLGVFLAAGAHNPVYLFLTSGPAGFLRTPSRYLFLSLWGLIAAAGAGARSLEPRIRPGLAVFLTAAAVVQLLAWGHGFLASEDSRRYLSVNPALASFVAGRPLRVLTDPGLASPDKVMLYRAMNVNGYDAFYLSGYPEFAARSEGRPAADPSRTYLSRADTPEMLHAGVAYTITEQGRLQGNIAALPLAYFAAGPGVAMASGQAAVSLPRPERWLVAGVVPAGADRMVVTVPRYPGWRAWLRSGSRTVPAALEPWDYFQSIRLPAGIRTGEAVQLFLDFRPSLWAWWAGISSAAWLVWLGLAWLRASAWEMRA